MMISSNSKDLPTFNKWSGVLWREIDGEPYAYCPNHKFMLDIHDKYDNDSSQENPSSIEPVYLLCPVDGERFAINGDYIWDMRRRYRATIEAAQYKNATYRDLDDAYIPVLKVDPKPKDDRYSIQVEVDNTKDGKKLVIYAMDRKNPVAKTQIFIDPQNDKITFDPGDLHPNMIFSKVVAYFKDGKKATLELSPDDVEDAS